MHPHIHGVSVGQCRVLPGSTQIERHAHTRDDHSGYRLVEAGSEREGWKHLGKWANEKEDKTSEREREKVKKSRRQEKPTEKKKSLTSHHTRKTYRRIFNRNNY